MKIYTKKQLRELAEKIRDNERTRILRYIYNNDEWFSSDLGETNLFLNMVIVNQEKQDGKTIKELKEHFDRVGSGKSII